MQSRGRMEKYRTLARYMYGIMVAGKLLRCRGRVFRTNFPRQPCSIHLSIRLRAHAAAPRRGATSPPRK